MHVVVVCHVSARHVRVCMREKSLYALVLFPALVSYQNSSNFHYPPPLIPVMIICFFPSILIPPAPLIGSQSPGRINHPISTKLMGGILISAVKIRPLPGAVLFLLLFIFFSSFFITPFVLLIAPPSGHAYTHRLVHRHKHTHTHTHTQTHTCSM